MGEAVVTVVIPQHWEETTENGTSEEEVICGIGNDCIIFPQSNSVGSSVGGNNVISHENAIMHYGPSNGEAQIHSTGETHYFLEQDFMGIQVAEEVITETWDNGFVVNEEIVEDDSDVKPECHLKEEPEDVEIPLPQDQDTYTTMRPYPCDFCSRRFRKKANLVNHMVAHQTDRPHGCNMCGARYRRKCDLINHMKIHAYAPGRSLLADSLDFGDDSMNDGAYSMTVDEESQEEEFQRGRKSVRGRQSSKARGRKKSFSGSSTFDMDMKYGHSSMAPRSLSPQSPPSMTVPRWPITDATRPYVCQHCGVGFAREKALASHARVHAGDSPFECSTCGEMFWDMGMLQEHSRTKHPGVEEIGDFTCDICSMNFQRHELLKRHRKLHMRSEDGPQSCLECGSTFSTQNELFAHAEIHNQNHIHRCMLCGQSFTDASELASHVRRQHTHVPPNSCTLCGKICRDRRSLQKHSWVHSAERSFACLKCNKRFHSQARLNRHMVSHRDKAVICEECGEEFPDGRALINHRHSHKDSSGRQFSCHQCGKTFGSRSSQQIHARIHTGERPYGCRFCWKAFADGGTLRKHERIHTGEKPYACPICPRAFNQRVVLREHIRSHHSGPERSVHGSIFSCKVCGSRFNRSEELCAHLIGHSDENTAKHRLPRIGPRKYKRRRKLHPYQSDLGQLSGISDSDEDSKHKIIRKKYKMKSKSDTTEGLESVAKTLESVVENINSIVDDSNAKQNIIKRKHKGKAKFINTSRKVQSVKVLPEHSKASLSNSMSGGFIKSNRPAGEGRVRPRTKNVTVTTLAALKAVSGKTNINSRPDNGRVRPRTKNVSYHNVKMAKLQAAKFPLDTKVQANPPSEVNDFDNIDGIIKEEYKCEMCSETFTRRSELLIHVPIHI